MGKKRGSKYSPDSLKNVNKKLVSPICVSDFVSPVAITSEHISSHHTIDHSQTTSSNNSDSKRGRVLGSEYLIETESEDGNYDFSNDTYPSSGLEFISGKSNRQRLFYDDPPTLYTAETTSSARHLVRQTSSVRQHNARQASLERSRLNGMVMYERGQGNKFRTNNKRKGEVTQEEVIVPSNTVGHTVEVFQPENNAIGHTVEVLPTTDNADVESQQQKVNEDAAAYSKMLSSLLEMEMCAICGIEESLTELLKIDSSIMCVIEKSGLREAYNNHVNPFDDMGDDSNIFNDYFRDDIIEHFTECGLLKGSDFVCRGCVREMKKGLGRHGQNEGCGSQDNLDRMPSFALISQCYRGEVPDELLCMNEVEVSMVSIVSVYSSAYLWVKYSRSKTRCYSVINDVAKVARELPRMPTEDEYVRIQTGRRVPSSVGYRPARVKRALDWLKLNNPLYKDISIIYPPEWSIFDVEDEFDINLHRVDGCLDSNDDGIDLLGDNKKNGEDAEDDGDDDTDEEEESEGVDMAIEFTPKNPGGGGFSNICVMPTNITVEPTNVEINKVIAPTEFAHPYHVQDFWYKAFPLLYPYGRGIPKNTKNERNFESSYVINTLKQGRGRDFQKNSKYYFLRYYLTAFQRIGGLSYTAAKNNEIRRFSEVAGDGITVKEMNEFIASRSEKVVRGDGTKLHFESGQSEVNSEKRIQDIARSLTPYSKNLPGTPMYKSLIRTQALSIISSPVVLNEGQFTWFHTRGQADAFSPLLYAIIDHDGKSGRPYSESYEAVKRLDQRARILLLRSHPALSVRCYRYQQMAYKKHIIMGKSKPLGLFNILFNNIIYN
jgi:hypothetical protein